MTRKFEDFELALIELCREHGVQLAASGHERIHVYDLKDGEDPLYGGLLNETEELAGPEEPDPSDDE